MHLFSAIYFLLSFLLYIIAIPLLLFLMSKKKYKRSIPARFFCYKNGAFKRDGIWFHACSLGEVKSLKPLIEMIEDEVINISTITDTGMEEAKTIERADRRFLPFEIFLPFWIGRDRTVVVMEAELWFMLFFIAKKRGSKTILLNGRISNRSFHNYLRFKFFYKMVFANIDIVYAQSQKDRSRYLELGAKTVEVLGNIKALATPKVTKEYKKPKELLIVGASTHVGEEIIILEAFRELENAKLVLAPRHPERFDMVENEIAMFCTEYGLSYSKISTKEELDSDIVLLDRLGELVNFYAIADIVVLGGSFVDAGGHNPIEPAHFNAKIISGVNIFNQFTLFEMIENYILVEEDRLASVLKNHSELERCYIKKENRFDRLKEELIGGKSI